MMCEATYTSPWHLQGMYRFFQNFGQYIFISALVTTLIAALSIRSIEISFYVNFFKTFHKAENFAIFMVAGFPLPRLYLTWLSVFRITQKGFILLGRFQTKRTLRDCYRKKYFSQILLILRTVRDKFLFSKMPGFTYMTWAVEDRVIMNSCQIISQPIPVKSNHF